MQRVTWEIFFPTRLQTEPSTFIQADASLNTLWLWRHCKRSVSP